jgi:hypothetical protein
MEKIIQYPSLEPFQPYTGLLPGAPSLNSLEYKTVIENKLGELKKAIDGFENSAIALRASYANTLRAEFDLTYKGKLVIKA